MSFLTLTHLLNDTWQVVCEERDSVLFQGTRSDCENFLSELHS